MITRGSAYLSSERGFGVLRNLPRGGIVGMVEIIDCRMASESPWFSGPYGFVLANAKELDFVPCKGRLGIFNIELPQKLF